jgi:hypothetical protein
MALSAATAVVAAGIMVRIVGGCGKEIALVVVRGVVVECVRGARVPSSGS